MDKFVAARKIEHETDGKIKFDDAKFHRCLTFARYLSAANGEEKLSTGCYDLAVELENAREKRIEAAEQTSKKHLESKSLKLTNANDQ